MSRPRRRKPTPPPAKQPLQSGRYRLLARKLQERTAELGLSVRELAARLDRPSTTVHKTLRANRRLDPIEFLDWCDALEWDDPLEILRAVRDA